MKCKECKVKIKKKAEYCPFCGAAIKTSQETRKGIVDINIILDKSGSMLTTKSTTIKEFNSYLMEQAQVEGKANVSLYMFNHGYEVIYENQDVRKAPLLEECTYSPGGTTALLDAIGKTISTKDTLYASMTEKPRKILFVIITDGLENASREFSREAIKKIIEDKKAKGWDIAFIGAGIDAFSESSAGGISVACHSTMNVAPTNKGISDAFSMLTSSTSHYRTSSSKKRFAFNDGDQSNDID